MRFVKFPYFRFLRIKISYRGVKKCLKELISLVESAEKELTVFVPGCKAKMVALLFVAGGLVAAIGWS
jgi:hypothetical protein